MSKKRDDEKNGEKQAANIPGWSWVVAGFGLLLVAGTVAFFLYQAFTGGDAPAEIVIETGEVVSNAGGYLVPIEVTNHGDEVAAGLVVEGTLMDGETPVETSTMTFDYVPVGSIRNGDLIFREDPREYELEVQARGYALP
jgi:uncharacterized protein (TIGR02588 family)